MWCPSPLSTLLLLSPLPTGLVQDPRYPVENLLHDDDIHPWLSCPQDRSRQLKVELQLERASPIGYIDIGNCGCAFLQVDVGRSSWPLDQPYVTLVPSTTLMTPADSKLDRNRSGVRMFKEGDFLAAALGEKWDRVRITCSQPFNKQAQFGLSFIHIRTPLDPNHSQAAPPPPPLPQMGHEPAASPWLASPAFRRAFFPEVQPSKGEEEEELKSRLQLLEPSCGPHPRSPACLSRTARMVLSAAQSRSRALQLGPSATSLAAERRASSRGQQGEDPAVSPTAAGPMQDVHDAPPLRKVRVKPSRRRRSQGAAGQCPGLAPREEEPGAGEEGPTSWMIVERQAGRWVYAPSVRAASAQISFPFTPLPVGKMAPFQTQPGHPHHGKIPSARSSLRLGCHAPSASSGSARQRWRGMPAPVGSRQEPWRPPIPGCGWNRAGRARSGRRGTTLAHAALSSPSAPFEVSLCVNLGVTLLSWVGASFGLKGHSRHGDPGTQATFHGRPGMLPALGQLH
ncbi:putative short transient receptor potential channel 2-like protein isoform X1 [Chelonia mydas]|uniref:putative short transient receptor potential channel 2-like protein isoform X1 n=1 Tax=Chelonia mydas TaxID=8469 RepID=UPI001CA7E9AA|nr:putative short transient receptor potential channel 2-like protein isoform X1 [Chelonia mydas]XP_043382926.1 putative short transient receptor potential channel 2-like protein isoform X1 [Chelonia mydas]XP_043382929.1 putative short transient receptor potential channel 2-like protein isoform X1 [Chelonia mydas]XP_043382930.1 putative short transient receptor potential channel 2-like protein isoform X1 [Chelonia mydas]